MMGWKIVRQDYLNFFRKADADRDGYLSQKELRTSLRLNGYKGSDADINVMFHVADTDGDNLISLREFWIAMGQLTSRKHVLDTFVRVFRRNDADKDGKVTAEEFKKACKDLEPYLTKDEFLRLYELIPEKDRDGFNYLVFKATIDAVWDSMDLYDEFWIITDKDQDGFISKKEFENLLKGHGYAKKDIEDKLSMVKTRITYEEYITAMGAMPTSLHKAAFMRKIFERYDTDKSGTISKRELKAACMDLGKAFSDRQIRAIMDKADEDGSGELDYEEFVTSIEEILAQQDAYEKFFRDADVDDSGYLTMDELFVGLRKGGYKGTDDQIRKMFNATDNSADRKISFDEYMQCMGRSPPSNYREAYMRRVFNDFDVNGDGKIDKKELSKAFKELGKRLSPTELDRIIALADTDQSGTLEYEEFIRVCFGK